MNQDPEHIVITGPAIDMFQEMADKLGITRKEAKDRYWPLLYTRSASSLKKELRSKNEPR